MKLLFVNCCISQRGTGSRTRTLADTFLAAFQASHPGAGVEEVTPETLLALKPFDAKMLDQRGTLAQAGDFSAPVYALARQFRAADAVVVAAPFWDLSYPAALRTYIEYISAVGLTYHYTDAVCCGDCAAEHLVYLTSSGDVEREDSVGVVHWRQLAAMFGIPRFDYVFAGGLDAHPDTARETLTAACALAGTLAKTL